MGKVSYHPIFTDSFKFNSFTVNFLMPLNEENATSAALVSQVLKRGCQKYGEMDKIVARLEELYGASVTVSSDKLGENLSFTIQGYYMDDRFAVEKESILEPLLDLMSDILLNPMTEADGFRSDFFAQEKNNHIDFIRGMINDKRTYSMLRCKELMFNNSQYRFFSYGTLEYLEKITAKSLYEFYRNMVRSSSVMVTYIGRKIDVETLTEKYFSEIFKGTATSPVSSEYVTPKNIRVIDESFDVAQGKLCMGFRIVEPVDFFAARLFNVIFGGSPTSKLFMNVREKMSLCYYCSSVVDPYVHCVFISSGIEFENYQVAKEEILRQLDDMKRGNITEEEFENGKLYLLDYIKGMKDSHTLLLSSEVQNYLLDMHYSIDEQIQKVSSLELDQIIRVANSVTLDTVYFMKGE